MNKKESSLSFQNIFQHETKLAVYIIVCMVVLVLGVSYALFLKVDSNSANQVVTAGDLSFTYKDGSTISSSSKSSCFEPMSDDEAGLYYDSCSYQFSVQNSGTLKANYTFKLVNNGSKIAASNLKYILKKQNTSGVLETIKSGLISELTDGLLVQEDIALKSQVVYSIQVYVLDDSLVDTNISNAVNYTIDGTGLVNEDAVDPDKPKPTAVEYVTTLAKNNSSLSTDEFKNIRYVGTDPDNYIYFNCSDYSNQSSTTCEKWRIIGIMKDVKTSANVTKDLIKIIKNDTMEGVTFGTTNNFASSQIMTTLNNTLKNDTTKNIVENVIWNLGGTSTISSPHDMYNIERSTTVYSGNATTATTKVGLMYPSDYGYASSGVYLQNLNKCLVTTMDNWTTVSDCINKNWLKPNGVYSDLTITQNTGFSYIMYAVGTDGILTNALTQRPDGGINTYNNAKPTVYLSSSLQISGGSGTSSEPYQLSV